VGERELHGGGSSESSQPRERGFHGDRASEESLVRDVEQGQHAERGHDQGRAREPGSVLEKEVQAPASPSLDDDFCI
jgi:hypothetical protein